MGKFLFEGIACDECGRKRKAGEELVWIQNWGFLGSNCLKVYEEVVRQVAARRKDYEITEQ